MSIWEAQRRIRKGAKELERVLNKVDRTPGRTDTKRRKGIERVIGSFVSERYVVVPPTPRGEGKRTT